MSIGGGMSEQPGFLTRYWRGEIALPISFWLVNFTATITLGVILSVLFRALETSDGYRPLVIFIGVAAGWAIAIVIQVWQCVGLWRSAGTYLSQHRGLRRLPAYLARLMVGAGIVANIPILVEQGFPQFIEVFKIAFSEDPDIPDYEVRLSEDKEEIHVIGGFKYGLAKDLRRQIEAAPTARVVVFESEGGRLGEAEAVFDLLVEKQLSTAVNEECASACALAFMGGKIVGSASRENRIAQCPFRRTERISNSRCNAEIRKSHYADIWRSHFVFQQGPTDR